MGNTPKKNSQESTKTLFLAIWQGKVDLAIDLLSKPNIYDDYDRCGLTYYHAVVHIANVVTKEQLKMLLNALWKNWYTFKTINIVSNCKYYYDSETRNSNISKYDEAKTKYIDLDGISPIIFCERLALLINNPIFMWLSNELRRKSFDYDVEKKAEKKEDELKLPICCVCMKEPRCIMLKNCNHLCVCNGCKDKLEKCPMCRLVVTSFERVYIS